MTVTAVVTAERVAAENDEVTTDAVVLSQDFILSQDFAQKKKNSFAIGGPAVFQHIDKGRAGVLEWSNICYSVKVKDGRKEIIKDVSGCLMPGKLTCILGPSGSGKTTLLNTLSGRVRPGGRFDAQISGTTKLNGQVTETWNNQHFFGYVMQDDSLFATETPREILTFAAKMRLRGIKPSEIACLVDNMLVSLGLDECASTMVGNDVIKGVSGGQKKRTSIAAELITNPAITFLDEPTSGLDTAAAHKVISVLKELAKADQSVMCTIHQPSSEVFELFDSAIFIARGQIVYMGPPSDIRSHFGAIGYQCPLDYNPADFVMYTLEMADDQDYATMTQALAKLQEPAIESKDYAARELPPRAVGRGFRTELSMLCARQYRNIIRDKETLRSRCAMTLFMPLIFCLVFFQAGDMDGSTWALQTHIGGITMMGMNAMMGAAQPAILTFPSERPVFLREYASKMYGVFPYFLSKTIAEFVLLVIQIHLSLLINYFGMGLHGVFHMHFIALFLVAIATSSIALLIGSSIGNVKTAMEVTPLAFVPQMLFAGFFIQMEQVPVCFRWIQYVCSLKWGLNIVQANEFGSWGAELPDYEAFLAKNDIDENYMGVYAAMLVVLTIIFRSLAMWKLRAAASTLYG